MLVHEINRRECEAQRTPGGGRGDTLAPDFRLDHLLPEDQFRLLAASMHFPRQLASRVTLQPQGTGAYDVIWGVAW
jgi:hypothetical protein